MTAYPSVERTSSPKSVSASGVSLQNGLTKEDAPAQYKARMQEHARRILGAVAAAAKTAGIVCETVQVAHEHPYLAIIDTVASKGCDLIGMASHGRHGISAIVLGSETVKVLTHCRVPVTGPSLSGAEERGASTVSDFIQTTLSTIGPKIQSRTVTSVAVGAFRRR
jgi:nucleotide-binding universal stress UspA family protein